MAYVMVRGRDGRAVPVQISERDLRAMVSRQQALAKQQSKIAKEQYDRFRNMPSLGAKIAGQVLSSGIGLATGTFGAGAFFGTMLTQMMRLKSDWAVGRIKSPLRAMPGLPFGGIRNVRTGKIFTPQSLAQINAAAKAAVKSALVGAPMAITNYSGSSSGGGSGRGNENQGRSQQDPHGDQRNSHNPGGGLY